MEEPMTSLDTALILDGSPIPSFVIDAKHKVVHWNQALAQLTGIPAREVIGTHHQWRAFYRAHRPVMADIVLDGCSAGLLEKFYAGRYRASALVPGAYEAEDFFPALGESGRWLSFSASHLRDAEGKVVGCIETLQDITARRAAEEARAESERRLAEIVASSPVATFVLDREGRVTHWNKACEALTGFAASEILGRQDAWRAFYGGHETRKVVLAELVAQGANATTVAQHYGDRAKPSTLISGAWTVFRAGRWGPYSRLQRSPRLGLTRRTSYREKTPCRKTPSDWRRS
jgi:PAS domain-containing protein